MSEVVRADLSAEWQCVECTDEHAMSFACW